MVNAGANQSVNFPMASASAAASWKQEPPHQHLDPDQRPGVPPPSPTASAATTATFCAPGTYVLQLAGSDGTYTNAASLTITVNPDPGPLVSAGSNQTMNYPSAANLSGSASETRCPPAILSPRPGVK